MFLVSQFCSTDIFVYHGDNTELCNYNKPVVSLAIDKVYIPSVHFFGIFLAHLRTLLFHMNFKVTLQFS